MRKRNPTPIRPGFTLVEMLMVIGIIIFLAGVLVVTIGRTGIAAREKATQALIDKVSKQVQERLEAFDRQRSQLQFQDEANSFVQGAYTPEQKAIIWSKKLLKLHFAQSIGELQVMEAELCPFLNCNQYSSLQAKYSTAPNYADPNYNPETESSELLYFTLTSSKRLGVPTIDPSEYKPSEVADTDGDGLPEFIDAWGKPLRIYRSPTRLICPSGTFDAQGRPTVDRTKGATVLINGLPALRPPDPDPLMKDQDDPTLLIQPTNSADAITFEQNYHTPQTYHLYLIVSSGPDGAKKASPIEAFGLGSPTDQYVFDSGAGKFILNTSTSFGYLAQPILTPAGFDALTDNITNRNR